MKTEDEIRIRRLEQTIDALIFNLQISYQQMYELSAELSSLKGIPQNSCPLCTKIGNQFNTVSQLKTVSNRSPR
ncbi:hypothetical protein NIES4075_57160 [Tolypothrix sp. NIES-4075]|nr:hypothetical protein NIES4075_57160 [Tolypothrix sp. NIES-4075]